MDASLQCQVTPHHYAASFGNLLLEHLFAIGPSLLHDIQVHSLENLFGVAKYAACAPSCASSCSLQCCASSDSGLPSGHSITVAHGYRIQPLPSIRLLRRAIACGGGQHAALDRQRACLDAASDGFANDPQLSSERRKARVERRENDLHVFRRQHQGR